MAFVQVKHYTVRTEKAERDCGKDERMKILMAVVDMAIDWFLAALYILAMTSSMALGLSAYDRCDYYWAACGICASMVLIRQVTLRRKQ